MQSPQRILVIDDHPLFREGLRPLLQNLLPEADIVGLDDVESALIMAKNAQGTVRLILVDLQLPRMGGLAAIGPLRRLLPDTPIAVVSGSEQQSDARAALAAGAQGFVPKTMRPPEMVHALRQVLEGGFYAPPSMMGAILGALPESGGSGADEHGLTQRQRQVLECLCQGLANKEIARQLNLTQNTIKTHISAIFKTLGVMSRTQAIIEARARGIVQG
ncbi:DNA-binding response regulator [Hylemonella gracilis]|uniref:DNA-binding response regulator n=1 Tax=Hylemonella gracilis TaxID=80880 RepID=A0A4P6UN62_9BURK|nr:response regulator transcription factor [Hylemonella gracilis]QBK06054.1 DNA-binding response regulator [Hylemonella gracilis]